MPQPRRCCQFAPFRLTAASLGAFALAVHGRREDAGGMIPESPLDDPRFAAFAWARYKRLMRWMALVTLTVIVLALILLYRNNGFVSIHFYIATALGIGVAMLLMSALMGLVFLSSGTGHDEAIVDPLEEDDEP
jgi:hypothetical protein